jgi:uncharacterized membrane protein YkvA (DUF1232 family)
MVVELKKNVWFRVLFVASIIYFLSPVDLVPDVIPIVGVLDDGAFIIVSSFLLGKNI